MTERAIADERLVVGREKAIEQGSGPDRPLRRRARHARRRGECHQHDREHEPLAHTLIIDLSQMKIGLVSLGCPKNLVDSEVMLGLAQQAGHELTRDPEGADVLIVVNTCAFIDKAKQESIDTILEMAQHKKDGSCQRLIVTGCMAERYRDELRKEIPEIDAVLGTGEVRTSSKRSAASPDHLACHRSRFTNPTKPESRSPKPDARRSRFQPTSMTPTRLGSSRRRGTTPT